jgi:hypothetical protein
MKEKDSECECTRKLKRKKSLENLNDDKDYNTLHMKRTFSGTGVSATGSARPMLVSPLFLFPG